MTPEQLQAKIDIKHCKSCPLFNKSKGPVPFYVPANPYNPVIAVQGEAPGAQEAEEGTPFVGPAGTLLRNKLGKLLDYDRLFLMNTICCLPDRKPPTPLQREVEACRGNLTKQLRAARPSYLLLLGSVAMKSYWPNMTMDKSRARWWQIPYGPKGYCWVMGTFHPAYILRRPDEMAVWLEDLAFFSFCAEQMAGIPEDERLQFDIKERKSPATGMVQGEQQELNLESDENPRLAEWIKIRDTYYP